jgi:hypothetical protein
MWDLFHHPLTDGEWFGILAGIVLLGVIGIKALTLVLAHMREGRDADHATALKMEMVQCGMSADEIERVLKAKISPELPSVAGQVGRAAGELVRKAMQ